jgi:glyoxylase-like metal-dependent hydrolase (beta-lactamase superfamily II)
MAQKRKWLRWGLLALVLLPVGLVVTMRMRRGAFESPELLKPNVVRLRNLFTEVYCARVGDKVVLFDAGIDTVGSALDKLIDLCGGKSRDDVSDVFLSHGHFDHVQMSALCPKATVHVGIRDTDMLAQKTRTEPRAARWFSYVLPPPAIAANAAFIDRTEQTLADGKKLIALPLPGHTPGSFLLIYDGILFAGDSMQINDGKLDFCMNSFSVDPKENHRNIAKLKEQLGGIVIDRVCTGHQGCTAAGQGAALLDDLIARAQKESS